MSTEEKVKTDHSERSRASRFSQRRCGLPAGLYRGECGGRAGEREETDRSSWWILNLWPYPASRAGKPPVAIGDQCSGVMRSSDLPWSIIAWRYSSQSGCSPEIERK
jgi:hypothetical protein